MAARSVRDAEVAGSSPATPTVTALGRATVPQAVSDRERMFYHEQVADGPTPLRRCSLCREEKHLTEFHRRGNGYQWWCKACRQTHDSAYHASRRELRRAQTTELKRPLTEWMNDLKTSQPCVDCGGWFHPVAMTFDHLPGTIKRDEVSDLVKSGCTKLAREEVLKCDVVCVNCHALRTYMRRMGFAEERGGWVRPSPTRQSIDVASPPRGTPLRRPPVHDARHGHGRHAVRGPAPERSSPRARRSGPERKAGSR